MTDTPLPDNGFLGRLMLVIEKNIANEQFGVTELAAEMNMSRSNLLRKVKKESKLSVSQLISQVRLKRAMELLRKTALNVSQVSHEVGFNSTSYFIKCFREYYGYPPGEVGKRDTIATHETGTLPDTTQEVSVSPRLKLKWAAAIVVVFASITIAFVFWSQRKPGDDSAKSIAVLPFKNDSNDSTNLYLINGLMESTVNKLQQIRDLRVVSRTSVEKYRNMPKSIPEMAKELNVRYFVEGSGQKLGDRILLNIQLIDASTDKHIWSRQYRRETKDIFELQEEIAKNITDEIEVFVTPDENTRIAKKPTEDPVAYDYYLKGKDLFYLSGRGDLEASIPWFKKAIERDPKFSLAYATAAMVYYYLDVFSLKKMYTADVDDFAEKAILYDSRSSETMIAKALSFAQKGQFELSIPYFEKALEYDPHSGLVLHFLTEFYNLHVPHPPKYLEYAIKKVKADRGSDSATLAFDYFHVSNALLQNGFPDDALKYSEKSLQLNPKGHFTGFVNDYIHYAIDHDPLKARQRLLARWKHDTTRFDILQEVGKMDFMAGDYAAAAACYDRSLATMKMFGLDIFKHEYLRIATAYQKVGQKQKAAEYAKKFKDFADHDRTIYKDLHLMAYSSYMGNNDKAIEYLKRFSEEQDNFVYWIILMPEDPLLPGITRHPEFNTIMHVIERKYWRKHDEVKDKLANEFKDL
jgi:TolB-like protein/AraC-like DNA-binding protein